MPKPTIKNKLYLYWQAESIRIYESEFGQLDDENIKNLVISKYDNFDQRVLYRASLLAKQAGLKLGGWQSRAKISLVILWLLAFLSGFGLALGALAKPEVNLASALIALLGLNTISFILWLLSYLPFVKTRTALTSLWLKINQLITKLQTKPSKNAEKDNSQASNNKNIASQAFLELFINHKLWPATIGIISNSTWLIAFIGAVIGLLIMLSTKSYNFYWATTILSAGFFRELTLILGTIPAWLGFPLPNTENLPINDFQAIEQVQWSIWLLGCLITWGLLPRLLALIICLLSFINNLGRLKFDIHQAAWLELKNKYFPRHQHLGIDKPADHNLTISQIIKPRSQRQISNANYAILGHELNPDDIWPPAEISTNILNLGISSSRSDQDRVRKQLANNKQLSLLVICNSLLTPDRGTVNWLLELQSLSKDLKIYLPQNARYKQWQDILLTNNLAQLSSISEWPQDDLRPAS